VKSPDSWIPLAEIARPHGVRGELRLKLFNKDSDVLLDADEVLVRFPDGDEQEVSVDAARRADDAILMKLHSVDDRNAADDLRGAILCLQRSALPKLKAGEFYAIDIEQADVFVAGEPWGKVKSLLSYPSVDVLEVIAGGQRWEIPLLDMFVDKLDAAAARVELKTIEGLEPDAPPKPKAEAAPRRPRPARKGT